MDRRKFIKTSGWSMLGVAAAGSLLGSCTPGSKEAKKIMPSPSGMKMFWGDLHNHCNLTYGHGDKRRIYLNVTGESCIDYVDIVKNNKIIARLNGPLIPMMPLGDNVRCKIKMEYGWNREEKYVPWNGKISISKGRILSATPCFRGAAFTSPQEGETEFHTHINRILGVSDTAVELALHTTKNPNTVTPATQAVILDVEMPLDGVITSDFNGKAFSHTLAELLEGSRSHFMRGWLSEAVLFNRAMPESCWQIEHYMEDCEPENDTDFYYIRVRQKDQQWAWTSPIWVER